MESIIVQSRESLDIGLIHLTVKSVIIELWKCGELPPILRSPERWMNF